MDGKTMLSVLMSMIFFAPLLVATAFFLFVGLLVAFEGAVSFAGKHALEVAGETASPAPAPGPIVAGLDDAIRDEAARAKAEPKRPTGVR